MDYFLFIGNLEIGKDDVKVSYKRRATNSSW